MKVKDTLELRAVVGTKEYRKEYVFIRVNEWVKLLSKITKSINRMHISYSHYVSDKNSNTLFEPYPTSAIYYNPSKMSFGRSYNVSIRRANM